MSQDGFIGEIKMFGGNFAPRGWFLCQGQLIPISSNSALFSILGTTYGGDGRTTFALPDLRGRVSIGVGQRQGFNNYSLGQIGGAEKLQLKAFEVPPHSHSLSGVKFKGKMRAGATSRSSTDPANHVLPTGINFYGDPPATVDMAEGTVEISIDPDNSSTAIAGGGEPYLNLQPYVCINYIICAQGTFPSRD